MLYATLKNKTWGAGRYIMGGTVHDREHDGIQDGVHDEKQEVNSTQSKLSRWNQWSIWENGHRL